MTDEQIKRITELREQGIGYGKIAQILDVSQNTVKSFCQRNNLGGMRFPAADANIHVCKFCGKEVHQNPDARRRSSVMTSAVWLIGTAIRTRSSAKRYTNTPVPIVVSRSQLTAMPTDDIAPGYAISQLVSDTVITGIKNTKKSPYLRQK